jgi:phosphatidylserine/phosphatidylglycerophosphate/cardiolipin synthase-like enzyme
MLYEPGQYGRVTSTYGRGHQEIKRSILKRLRGSERVIWMATAYFVPSIKIRRALRRAARRGVDVRVLLPGQHTDHPAVRHAGRRFYLNLLRAGVRIYEYKPRFTHAKLLMCDSWISIGSSNIDRWNLRWNLEANQEVESAQLASEAEKIFMRDFDQSEEIVLAKWQKRSRWVRMQEWFWGHVDIWLNRFTERRKFRRRYRKR